MLEMKVEKWMSSIWSGRKYGCNLSAGSLEMRRFQHVVMPRRHCLTLDPTPPTSRTVRR